ncbi:bifunctional hydroxymethylpyrimidine kinase/phosphomethylpyrimidine kinase [Enterococcus sp. HY326]|uniref:bifunctional hydroxymethylpyrimidine kinase/phosphomethylpyrimidine kinase n=1 Tax=Enterococcus sp. HY326 TaxID=2971265 RepID=UPI0022401557|nr:bifunctional hydroxymethylpyrimidine kinase/phosphomethylpyrimidine kinase [Enterococcus sp. HY326]
MENKTPQVVTIAGSDSGGGAGIQADLKTFQARHAFGMSIIVALTAQNTYGVQDSLAIPSTFIDAQFASLAVDFAIKACKTGMLADIERVETVVKNLKKYDFGPLIVDPVMIAKGGHPLLQDAAVAVIKEKLLPLATVVTPNLPEAEVILGREIKTAAEMIQAAKDIQAIGAKNVIIKGGHSADPQAADFILLANQKAFWLKTPRVETENTHGTGDTFSACIAAELAKGTDLETAIIIAKGFIQGAISEGISVGHGHGPTNHWAQPSEEVDLIIEENM